VQLPALRYRTFKLSSLIDAEIYEFYEQMLLEKLLIVIGTVNRLMTNDAILVL
jgi:hypothetical protein